MRARLVPVFVGLAIALSDAASAQWLNYPTPGIPRTADGKPNLNAAAPRMPDGKPDFTGMWRVETLLPCDDVRRMCTDLPILSSDGGIAPPRLLARMNEFVYRSTPASKYASFFYAPLDEQGRRLRYVNAGHNAPYLLRAGRRSTTDSASLEIEQLSVGGTVVGMFPEMGYDEATVELYPGDVLLVFTDGVPEAHNPANEEFGDERLQQLLRQAAHLPADEISARFSNEMKNWIRDAEQYDDLTFIVMKVR